MNSEQRNSRITYGLSATEKKHHGNSFKPGLNGLNAGYAPGLYMWYKIYENIIEVLYSQHTGHFRQIITISTVAQLKLFSN